jgi:hypothetical protein
MRNGARREKLADMPSQERIVLRLEVDRDADPITGTLSDGAEDEHRFTGWLDLTNVIESIRAAHGQAAPGGDRAAGD